MMGKHQLGIELSKEEVSQIVTWLGSLTGSIPTDYIKKPTLPESTSDFLLLRPLGGSTDDIAGLHTALERVESASYPLPDVARDLADVTNANLLRTALRLGFRSSAGPFRSFGRIAVSPWAMPYEGGASPRFTVRSDVSAAFARPLRLWRPTSHLPGVRASRTKPCPPRPGPSTELNPP